jgi:hypothetical protein
LINCCASLEMEAAVSSANSGDQRPHQAIAGALDLLVLGGWALDRRRRCCPRSRLSQDAGSGGATVSGDERGRRFCGDATME